jgi:pyrroline-5-carboxylate reductase
LIFEAFVDTAVELGFSRSEGRAIVLQLFEGSAVLAKLSPDKHLAQLKNQVTSPGGTTAVGLASLGRAKSSLLL